jgi:hypothetical protein
MYRVEVSLSIDPKKRRSGKEIEDDMLVGL